MKIYTSADEFTHIGGAVVAIGMFDGVHAAHQVILKKLTEQAEKLKGVSVVVSFEPHPREVLSGKFFPLIVTAEEKQILLERFGLDIWCRLPFTKEFASQTAEEFVSFLSKKMEIMHVVLGYNHSFGSKKSGNIKVLSEKQEFYRFGITEVPEQKCGAAEISSSVIREALREGDIETANRLLGYEYFILAKQLEWKDEKTAVFRPCEQKLLPRQGVYEGMINKNKSSIEIISNQTIFLNFGRDVKLKPDWNSQTLYFYRKS